MDENTSDGRSTAVRPQAQCQSLQAYRRAAPRLANLRGARSPGLVESLPTRIVIPVVLIVWRDPILARDRRLSYLTPDYAADFAIAFTTRAMFSSVGFPLGASMR